MVGQDIWREDPEGWKAKGVVKANGRGLCGTCYVRAYRRGLLKAEYRRAGRPKSPVLLSDNEVARLRAAVGLERAA